MTDLEKACASLARATENVAEAARVLSQVISAQQEAAPDGVKLYTVDELAEIFRKSKDVIRRWIGNKEFGEPVKTGNSVMIPQAGLDKYLADHSGPLQKRDPPSRSRRTRSAAADLSDMRI